MFLLTPPSTADRTLLAELRRAARNAVDRMADPRSSTVEMTHAMMRLDQALRAYDRIGSSPDSIRAARARDARVLLDILRAVAASRAGQLYLAK